MNTEPMTTSNEINTVLREPTDEKGKDTSERAKDASESLEVEENGIRLFNGNLSALRSAVQQQDSIYLESDPGRDTVAPNVALQNAIQRLEKGDDFNFNKLKRLYTQIDYRLRAMDLADRFVEALGVPKPGGIRCAEWNWKSADIAEGGDQLKFNDIWQKVAEHGRRAWTYTTALDFLGQAIFQT